MAKFYEVIPENLQVWALQQQIFWVATAPLVDGHVNVSPKGVRGCLHIIDEKTVWYEDLTGSGAETIAHLRENGRITLLLSAFEGPPRIMRFFGTGQVHEFGTPEYDQYIPTEKRNPGSRAVIMISVSKVQTSCGYAVPYYGFQGHRTRLLEWAAKKEAADLAVDGDNPATDGLKAYWVEKNLQSQDGIPSLQSAHLSSAPAISTQAGLEPKEPVASSARKTLGFLDLNLVVAFSAGLLVAAAYVRLSATRT